MNQELQEQIHLQRENEKWKKLLQSNLFNICKIMDPDAGLIDCLLSEQVLNKRAADSCQTEELKYKRNHAILDIVMRRSFDDFVKLCKALCDTGQIHVVEGFFNPEKFTHLSCNRNPDTTDAVRSESVALFDWRDFVKKQLMVLIEVIDPDNGLIKALAFRKIIPEWTTDKYTSKVGRCSRVEELLFDLMHKGDGDYQKFCEALIETNQRHVVDDYLSQGAVGCIRHSLQRSQTYPDGFSSAESPVIYNWKDVLIRQQSNLVDNIDPNQDLINHLERINVMNRRCAERCKEIRNDHERTTFILDFMRMRPERDFRHFCEGLVLTNQEHVVNTYFKVDERTSTAVQESISAPVTPLGQLEIGGAVGDSDQLAREWQQRVRESQPQQPAGDGDFHRRLGQSVHKDDEITLVAVHPAKETSGQAVQEQGDFIDDEGTRAKCLRTEGNKCDDLGYNSLCDAQHSDKVRLRTAAADPSWEMPPLSDDQPIARNDVVYHDDSLYGSRPSSISNVCISRSSSEFYTEHCQTSYPMNRVCRGKCIIFNNHKFIRMRGRKGTEVDSALLKKLFEKLLFNVEEVKDAAAEEITSKLCAISQDKSLEKYQCLVIFILSHGDYQNGQCIMHGSDEKTFTLEDVLKPFAPNSCGCMNGKPKLVFIQACRGEQYDYSQSDSPSASESHQNLPLSYPDFLVGFPTQAGYRAFRDIENGSWYINALTRTFMARAHNTSLNSMMNSIAGAASRWLSQTGNPETDNKTQYAIYTCSFTKDLFFFPGIFE